LKKANAKIGEQQKLIDELKLLLQQQERERQSERESH